ncbi:hypothetical protein [Parendozoicomonas haliclonae]|uniref:Uncharacterized protein n=1 Tax=Parendozoicomonas haliclonae TaxID=1960125 RepID=A0A1X7AHE0_9GAMM|nr:hypothetical protein [Parendozoicomonas haliclonae]SMA41441.1 hypothetical protein EHSB41UT_01254 [Parendozoicomonas haliclonae]
MGLLDSVKSTYARSKVTVVLRRIFKLQQSFHSDGFSPDGMANIIASNVPDEFIKMKAHESAIALAGLDHALRNLFSRGATDSELFFPLSLAFLMLHSDVGKNHIAYRYTAIDYEILDHVSETVSNINSYMGSDPLMNELSGLVNDSVY